jgi:RecB family exonuclease
VISPRITRLVRVADLQSMHAFLARSTGALEARASAVIVPTRGAAEALRRTLEDRCLADAKAVILPDLMTRSELYERLHARLPGAPPRLTEFERNVIFRCAAEDAAARGAEPPFPLRAGLIVEILSFYDELRRRDRTIEAFARNMVGALEPHADTDRGAERLLRLTRFLAAAFEAFETRVAATGSLDEHGVRARLVSGSAEFQPPFTHVIVTVPDQAADPHGLWLADYDLLARMPGIARIEVVATENVLAAGYHERLHLAFPGIEEVRFATDASEPVLAVPASGAAAPEVRWFVARDREEELADVARDVKHRRIQQLDRYAVVFQRPLPYLYLARQVFPDAQVPYQSLDALPLAAEPFAAAVDLVFSFLLSEATRAALLALLRSPHFAFDVEGRALSRADMVEAETALRNAKYLGGWDRLDAFAAEHPQRALRAAAAAAGHLRKVADAASASEQLAALLAFLARYERVPAPDDPWTTRHQRARAAILGALASLADAHRAHDDRPVPVADLANTVRRWIEAQTFSPRTGSDGVLLLDAPAAAYADVDEVRITGLVESDWPDRGRRSIFYPVSLLSHLGWHADSDRLAAARARFQDLLRIAKRRISLSTFTLEEDAIIPGSAFLDEVDRAGLAEERVAAREPVRVFLHEALSEEPIDTPALSGVAAEWLALRTSRSDATDAHYHGSAGLRQAGVYAVSSIERYLDCPFKYFAAHVLRLAEERDDESGMTPQERGHFLHAVFEGFFREWQRTGRGTITTRTVADAVRVFEEIAERHLATLPEADRALERTHLLGSAAAPGLAERAFAFEIEQGGEVLDRLLEHELTGEFLFTTPAGRRAVRLRAKADRIDLMSDGTLRIVDYKLGKAPKPGRALQLSVYGVCAEQALAGTHNRTWSLGRAGYVAFKEKNAFVALGASSSLEEAVNAGQERLLGAIDAIERGEFPPRPDEPFLCTRCGYATVCRKDYVGDE